MNQKISLNMYVLYMADYLKNSCLNIPPNAGFAWLVFDPNKLEVCPKDPNPVD